MWLHSPLACRVRDRNLYARVGPALPTFLTPGTPLVLVVLDLAWLGVSFALFSSPNTNAVMTAVDRRANGVAAGTLATMRALGQMFSMGIAMLLLSFFIARVQGQMLCHFSSLSLLWAPEGLGAPVDGMGDEK